MNRVLSLMILTMVTTLGNAQSVGRIAKVAVIDRDTGATLVPHLYRGEYWLAGVPGARYAIEIRNRLGERLLAVTSVDGVNVVSGETASWDQVGYVFSAGERYKISGWRKSDTDVAAFTFTSLPNSYAARTGRPENVGVIGIAVFRERQSPPSVALREHSGWPAPVEAPSATNAPVERAADAAASAGVGVTGEAASSSLAQADPVPAAKLGTGHGDREYSYVNHTEFLRSQSQPNELIRIHYDSAKNLMAMGIIRGAAPEVPRAPASNPFPGSPDPQYVPDPQG